MNHRNPFGNGGNYRRTRRGVSKQKRSDRQLQDALKKLKAMEALEAKVILLDAERAKVLEKEQLQKAKDEAQKLEIEENERMTALIAKAITQSHKELGIAKPKEAAEKEAPSKTAEEQKMDVSKDSGKKSSWSSWFSWLGDW